MAETYALVWIKFRMRVSQFTQTVFDPASAYAAGALVLSSAGEGYRAITAVPINSELTDPIYWEAQPFPAFLDDFVIHAAAADLLAGEGQTRAAASERELANVYLSGAQELRSGRPVAGPDPALAVDLLELAGGTPRARVTARCAARSRSPPGSAAWAARNRSPHAASTSATGMTSAYFTAMS